MATETTKMYLLTEAQVTAIRRAGPLGTAGPGAIEALSADIRCGTCEHWCPSQSRPRLIGDCSFGIMSPGTVQESFACVMWAAKEDQR